MKTGLIHAIVATFCVVSLGSASCTSWASSPSNWSVVLGASGGSLGTYLGIAPWGSDDDTGLGDMLQLDPASKAIYLLKYFQPGPDWTGRTGFSGGDMRYTPIPAGGSRTWSDLYLWAQNKTPGPTNLTLVYSGIGPYSPPPAGYRGHLVLDYVPDSCNWTGKPMDYWLDLTTSSQVALPIPVVTDPLQGTRFHLDVYAPVPEPSCLAALATGLAGIAGVAVRRKRA